MYNHYFYTINDLRNPLCFEGGLCNTLLTFPESIQCWEWINLGNFSSRASCSFKSCITIFIIIDIISSWPFLAVRVVNYVRPTFFSQFSSVRFGCIYITLLKESVSTEQLYGHLN